LKPVPIGVAGELYIGGRTVTRGYFGRPELTAQRFIPHPFSNQKGARLYRTGDLARYLPDGDIEFLGRIDNQVKVRGFRIELEEIEVALSEHPSVESAAVVAMDYGNGDKRLVAYVVISKIDTVTTGELHDFIQTKLPDYMVPSLFITLDEIPRTPQGKVDRKALPVPDRARPELDERLVLPSTENEKMLADIWMSLLHLDQMGVHDNFFDLGGHSLLATQLVSQIRETFKVEMPLYTVFEKPTISKLAIAVEDLRNSGKTQTSFIKKLPREAHRVKRASLHLEN
jgi:acyl carrier protein